MTLTDEHSIGGCPYCNGGPLTADHKCLQMRIAMDAKEKSEQLKELAEFIPEIVPTEKKENGHYIKAFGMSWRIHYTNKPFEGDLGAILAHLAKREMENRGFDYVHTKFPTFHKFIFAHENRNRSYRGEHENEYITLWLAIREAVR